MTLENCKRLYKHYVDNNMTAQAEDISKKRPEVLEEEVVVEEKPKKKK